MGDRSRAHRARFFVTANQQIAFPTLRVMDERGVSLGIMSKKEALQAAFAQEKDLILITDKAQPPVAKIIEYSKYKFQLSQKKSDERKKSQIQDIKELRLRPFIDENDLQSKLRKAVRFIKRNDKVRLCMELKGRAITKQELAQQILERFVNELSEIASVETPAKLMGKKIQLQLMPKKKRGNNYGKKLQIEN